MVTVQAVGYVVLGLNAAGTAILGEATVWTRVCVLKQAGFAAGTQTAAHRTAVFQAGAAAL